jgi:hypothetical protein
LAGDAVTILNYTSSIAALPTSRNVQDYTATAAQTTFTVTAGYIVGLIDVFVNGSKLTSSEFTATNGTTFVLTIASTVGDQVQSINYTASVNGISGAGTINYVPKFTASGTIGNSSIQDSGSALTFGLASTFSGIVNIGTAGTERLNIFGAGSQYINIKNTTTNADMFVGMSSGLAAAYIGTGGTDPVVFVTVNTERMRITSAGGLLINATSSTYGAASGYNLGVKGTSSQGFISIARTGQSLDSQGMIIGLDTATAYFSIIDNLPLSFATNNAERMRITSGGYLKASNNGTYLGATSSNHEFINSVGGNYAAQFANTNSSSPFGIQIYYSTTINGTSNRFIDCEDNTTLRFSVRSNGGIANYQANNVNLSDERTKKDISPLESYWNKFKDIEIVKFKYKDQTHHDFNIGVIAQQVESVAPEFVDVDGWGDIPEDGVPLRSVYTSDLHHATIKVLQEAMIKIEELSAKVTLLENK